MAELTAAEQTRTLEATQQDNNKIRRKLITEESLNTKNFLKKMAASTHKKEEKAQPKITSFLNNMSNTTSYGDQGKDGAPNQQLSSMFSDINEHRLKQLQEHMRQKDLQIQRMRKNKDYEEHRYGQLYRSNKQYVKKSKNSIAQSMLQAAQYRRAERREINPKLGYFKDHYKTFVDGSMLIALKQKISEKLRLMKDHEQDKKSKNYEKKQRAILRSEHLGRELTRLQKELLNCQSLISDYKETLKLAQKQSTCEYALKGWPIIFQEYQPLELLGTGGFGEVYKAYNLQQNEVVALKINTFKEDPEHQEDFLRHVTREAEIMKKLKHPHISKFHRLLECNSKRVTFSLEYCSGPELSKYLLRNKSLEQKEAKQIIWQILSALSYLSSLQQKVIHYDLKPSNILFHNGMVKVLDFGLCKPMSSEQSRIQLTSQGIGTYYYLPPETFREHPHHIPPEISPKVDVWSTGIIFFQLLYGRRPFGHGKSQQRIFDQGIILDAKSVEFPSETPKKSKVSEAAKKFIGQLLAYDPSQRLDPESAFEHEYFKK